MIRNIGMSNNGYREKKLKAEAVQVKNNKVVDYKTLFWDQLYEIE